MAEALYQDAIVAAARRGTGAGRLEAPSGTALVDNPLCGDRVRVDVALEGGSLARVGHQVRGCLLCEAAAVVIAEHAPGAPVAQLETLADAVRALLRNEASPQLPPGWSVLEMFAPVRPHRSRHECVLLPFQALRDALREGRASEPRQSP